MISGLSFIVCGSFFLVGSGPGAEGRAQSDAGVRRGHALGG